MARTSACRTIASWVPAITSCRDADGDEQRSAVRTGRDRPLRKRDPRRRAAPDPSAHRVDDVCLGLRSGLSRRATIGSTMDSTECSRSTMFGHCEAVIARTWGVSGGARVAERQRANPFRREPPQGEGEVASHREAYHATRSMSQGVERRDHRPGESHRGLARRQEEEATRRSPRGRRARSACRPTARRPGDPTARHPW